MLRLLVVSNRLTGPANGLRARTALPRRGTSALGVALALALAFPPGCGARTTLVLEDDPSGPSPASSEQCAVLAAAFCERLEACDYARFHYGTGLGSFSFRDAGQCRERVGLACRTVRSLPGSAIDTGQVRACAKRLTNTMCGELGSFFEDPALYLCDWSSGRGENGEPCRLDLQCRSGRCQKEKQCGVCASAEPPGGDCAFAATPGSCPHGFSCTRGKCARDGVAGARCFGEHPPCRIGLECEGGKDQARCTSPYGAAAPCAGACDASRDLACDRAADRCAALRIAPSGKGCGNLGGASESNPPVCEPGNGCENQNDFGSGTCRALGLEGDSCKDFEGPGCLFPAVCVAGTCALQGGCR